MPVKEAYISVPVSAQTCLRAVSLITSGAGFVGSHIVDALIARGEHVIVVDDLMTGSLDNLDAALNSGRCTFLYGDVAECAGRLKDILVETVSSPLNRIIHLASESTKKFSTDRSWQTLAANGPITMKLIELAIEHEAEFIYASMADTFESELLDLQPDSLSRGPTAQCTFSAFEGVRFGEISVVTASRAVRLNATIFRLLDCYGPRMNIDDGRSVSNLIKALMHRGHLTVKGRASQKASLTYIGDAVDRLLRITEKAMDSGACFELAGERRSLEATAIAIAQIVGVTPTIAYIDTVQRPLDAPAVHASCVQGVESTANTSIEVGILATIAELLRSNLITA